MKKILLLGLASILLNTGVFAAEEKSLCTVALKTGQMIVYGDESSYLASSLDQCLCAARNEVIGTRLERKTKKIRVRFMKGEQRECGSILNRKKCISYDYKLGSQEKFTVDEIRGLNFCH